MEQKLYSELNQWKGKRWFVGDIHGCLNTFRTLIEQKIKLHKDDILILLGDLVDRGPNSKGLLDYVMKMEENGQPLICIKGNHEDLMINAWNEAISLKDKGFWIFKPPTTAKDGWWNVGGKETMESFETKDLLALDIRYKEFLERMIYYLKMPDLYAVHGGFNFEDEAPFTNFEAMMWIREFAVDLTKTEGRKVVHGHVPLDLDFIIDLVKNPKKENFIPLDNGVLMDSIGKGHLLAYCPESQELIAQKKVD